LYLRGEGEFIVLLRDRLLARMAEMGREPDHQRLALEVLGIRNAPPDLARRLVAQALVVDDRREAWRHAGARICAGAPSAPGVYVLRDETGRALYVGKAINLRRRLRAHFAERRWRGIKAALARVANAEWEETGSEVEALLREAELIQALEPVVNVQIGPPDASTRDIPSALVRDVVVVVRSVEPGSAELIAARADGGWLIQRTRRSGADLAVHATRLIRFFKGEPRAKVQGAGLAPIVFSWLAHRGAGQSRIDPHDVGSPSELRARLAVLLADERLFTERIVVLNSTFRSASKRP
jgi:predicted GIY-YIG superfamily endonuclease